MLPRHLATFDHDADVFRAADGARFVYRYLDPGNIELVAHDRGDSLGERLDKLVVKRLYNMEDRDLAKAWSLFDYVAKKLGKEGQLWLRAGCVASKNYRGFLEDWRKRTGEIFGFDEQDPFKALDDRWRDYAQHEQDISEEAPKKRKR